MSDEVKHVPVAYPSLPDGLHSLTHLAQSLVGSTPLSTSETVAHAWVATGAGLSELFPLAGFQGDKAMALTAVEKASLERFLREREAGMTGAIDWKALLRTILPLILRLLVLLIVGLGLAGAARSAEPLAQAPSPPQAPVAVRVLQGVRQCPCQEIGVCSCGLVCTCQPAVAVKPAPKVKKTCRCSTACTCGCNVGQPCRCGPTAVPVGWRPVQEYAPLRFSRSVRQVSTRGGC